jgi:glycerol transport system ATP-binding protein
MRAKWCRSERPKSCSTSPEHTFVGYFIGSPGMNLLIPCEISGKTARVGGVRSDLGRPTPSPAARCEIGMRPEFVPCPADRSGHAGADRSR